MKKPLKITLAAFVFAMAFATPLFAKTQVAFEYSAVPGSGTAHLIALRGEFYVAGDFALTAEAGYGFRRYEEGESLGNVYGPSLGFGALYDFKITGKVSVPVHLKASIAYALFPTILWAEAGMGVRYRFSETIALNAALGLLFASDSPEARLNVGFVI